MAKTTIKVDELKSMINLAIASDCSLRSEVRAAYANLLEQVLNNTGNYKGYRYLTENEIPVGFKPGIRTWSTSAEKRFDNTDNTRVEYF
jgi:hypothetical protein